MITEQDLLEAIAECQGQRNPNASTCIKLAAFYTIKRELFDQPKVAMPQSDYSYASAPDKKDDALVEMDSDTEFARMVVGRKQSEIMPVIDELMETVKMIHPRLYNAVLDKL